MDVNGVSAIVTGGASGLGAATARRLARDGAKVTIFDLDAARGGVLAQEIGGRFVHVDVTSAESAEAGMAEAAKSGPLRVLVCCAGISDPARVVAKGAAMPLEKFIKTININLIGTFNVLRLAAAAMANADPVGEERGVIICTASAAAFEGQVGQAAYAASKAAVHGMTLPVARDLADKAIRVNTIAPGILLTPMLMGIEPAFRDALAANVPFPKRLGDPDEYAALVAHLVSNAYINGETIRLDGALRMAPR